MKFGARKFAAQIRPFKDFLEKQGAIIDSSSYYLVRNERIDAAWGDLFDHVILYHHPAGTWKSLTHVEFFRYLSGYLLHNEDLSLQDMLRRLGNGSIKN